MNKDAPSIYVMYNMCNPSEESSAGPLKLLPGAPIEGLHTAALGELCLATAGPLEVLHVAPAVSLEVCMQLL